MNFITPSIGEAVPSLLINFYVYPYNDKSFIISKDCVASYKIQGIQKDLEHEIKIPAEHQLWLNHSGKQLRNDVSLISIYGPACDPITITVNDSRKAIE